MEEQPKKRGVNPFIRFLLLLILIAVICGLLLFALTGADVGIIGKSGFAAFWQQAVQSFTEELPQKQVVTSFTAEEPEPVMAIQGEAVLLCTGGELRCMNADGTERWIRPVQLGTPFVTAYGRDVLYSDLSGKKYGIVRDGAFFFEKETENQIYNAFLSRDYILLLEKGTKSGYAAILEGFSREGAAVFTSYLNEYAPFSIHQAPETGQDSLVLSGLSATQMQAGAAVEFIAPDMARRGGVTAENDLYTIILQMMNGSTALVGEKGMKLLDRELATAGEYKPEGDAITAAALLDGKYPVLAVFDNKRYDTTRQEKTNVRILNEDGSLKREIVQEGRVDRLVPGPGCIGLVLANRVIFVDAVGTELMTFDARGSIRKVAVTANGMAYIMADGQVTALRLRVRQKFLGVF
jgi:hypothetical protein